MARLRPGEVLSAGMILGALYFAANLVLSFPHEQLFLMRAAALRGNLFLYSFSVWTVGFVLLSLVLYVVTVPVLALGTGRRTAFFRRWIVYFVLAAAFLVGFRVWAAYSESAVSLPGHVKVAMMRSAAVAGVVIAAGVSLLAAALATFTPWAERRIRGTGFLAAVFFLACVYVIAANLAGRGRTAGTGASAGPVHTRTVLVVADGGSWNVLAPLVENGDLPAFARFTDEGVVGFLSTHGVQFTPPSWTSIATGKTQAKHGVSGFTNLSSDWEAAPVWSIMSRAGKTVGVANWICTWPPFAVNGVFVSNVITHYEGLAFASAEFEDYVEAAGEITRPWKHSSPDADTSIAAYAAEELRRISELDAKVFSRIGPDLIAYGYYSTDKMQHFYWKDTEPEHFASGDWAGEPTDPTHADAIRRVWVAVDGFLSELMDTYGEETNYFVVSDHGARRIENRAVEFDVSGLLERMGYLVRDNGEVDYGRSRCYPSRLNMTPFVYDLMVRPDTSAGGVRSGGGFDALRGEIVRRLRALRSSGDPVFSRVDTLDGNAYENAPDLRVFASELLMEMPSPEVMLQTGDGEMPLADLMQYGSWSGRHRARGILLAKGPAIARGYTGAWTIDEPYTSIVRYGYGVFGAADRVYPLLRRLHLVDAATTLDLTPTILYVNDLPVARDMDGRVLRRVIAPDYLATHRIRLVASYEKGVVLEGGLDEEDREAILERLKDLGYL